MTSAEAPFQGLGITQKEIDRVRGDWEPCSDDAERIFQHTQTVMSKLRSEQQILYDSIRTNEAHIHIYNPLVFEAAVALVYEMLPETQRLQPLNENELFAAQQSMREYTSGEENHLVDLDWYVDKLHVENPEFSDWLSSIVIGLDQREKQSDFIFGAVLVSLPFYMRLEAKALENTYSK